MSMENNNGNNNNNNNSNNNNNVNNNASKGGSHNNNPDHDDNSRDTRDVSSVDTENEQENGNRILRPDMGNGLNITISGGKDLTPAPEETDDGSNPRFQTVPVLSLNSVVVFPFALTPLVINGDNAIRLVESSATDEQRLVGLFPELPQDAEERIRDVDGIDLKVDLKSIEGKTVSAIGVLGRIVKMMKFPDGTVRVLVRGLTRIRLLEEVRNSSEPFSSGRIERLSALQDNSLETIAMVRNSVKQFQEIVSYSPNFPEELKIAVMNLNDNTRIVDLIADTINISYYEKLAILSLPTLQERLHLLTILLNQSQYDAKCSVKAWPESAVGSHRPKGVKRQGCTGRNQYCRYGCGPKARNAKTLTKETHSSRCLTPKIAI